MRRAVFLDRDGVLNHAPIENGRARTPVGLDELQVLPGVADALHALHAHGWLLIVVTNQPDVARGTRSLELVQAINNALMAQLPLDDFLVCYHDNADNCECRKPRPGLLLRAAQKYDIDLSSSFMVGDRWRDIEAGARAGCRTCLVDYGYAESLSTPPDHVVRTLPEAARWILEQSAATRSVPLKTLTDLTVKIFADGADRAGMLEMYGNPLIKGFTTNPTLMRKAGVTDYEAFAVDVLKTITDRPICFEVFSDEFDEMERQACKIAGWGENVHVKIPITNTRGESSLPLVRRLTNAGVKLNVTALMTVEQVCGAREALAGGPPAFISLFAGRVADTGRDPVPLMAEAVEMLKPFPSMELIWSSPRELLNIFQADAIGCHIITVTTDLLNKLNLVGKDLTEFSLDTVKMFRGDALKAGYVL